MKKQTGIIIFVCSYISAIASFLTDTFVSVFSILLIAASVLCFVFKKITPVFLSSIIVIFFVGILNSSYSLKSDDDLSSLSDTDATVSATVVSIPSNSIRNKTKFYADVNALYNADKTLQNINAKTYVTLSGDENEIRKIKIGDNVKLSGRIKSVKPVSNPYQFDYARYLRYKNTFSVMYCDKNPEIISQSKSFSGKLIRKLNDTRNRIINIHARNIKSPMLEILGGIIFGDDAVNPDENTKKSFINSGIFHILAASGMNVTLIFGIWFFFAKRLRFNYRFSIVAGMLLILFYTCMTGFGPPVIRAYLMLTLILAGKLYDRKASTMSLLFIVAFLMLLYNPLMLFDVGFQLSFLVTFALIFTCEKFDFKNSLVNNILGACFIPFIAQLYAFPLQMFYFNTFTCYSVFANIAVIPVLSFVSFLGFISSIIAVIPPLAQKVCFAADICLNPFLVYIVKVANFFSSLPHSILYVPKPSLLQVFLYYLLIISLTVIIKNRIVSKRVFLLILTVFLIFIMSFVKIPDKRTEIIFFSVGNADAILVKTGENKYFLNDTGKLPYMSASSQAKNIILNYLKNKGVKETEALILSHYDADHAGGAVDILNNIKVNNVYVTDVFEDTKLSGTIEKYFNDNNIRVEKVYSDKEIYKDKNTVITLLRPESSEVKTENQKSLAVHIKTASGSALLSGDGDVYSYNALADKYKKNAVIKSGHHGAKNTVNDEIAKNSEIFVISTGFNIYGHPDKEVLQTIEKNGKKYFRTDYHNAIKVIFDEKNYSVEVYSPKTRSFVRAE